MGTTTYRPWNWAERFLAWHVDENYRMEAWFAARAEHQDSLWWHAERAFDRAMSELIAWVLS